MLRTEWSLHVSKGLESIHYVIFEATYIGISTTWFNRHDGSRHGLVTKISKFPP